MNTILENCAVAALAGMGLGWLMIAACLGLAKSIEQTQKAIGARKAQRRLKRPKNAINWGCHFIERTAQVEREHFDAFAVRPADYTGWGNDLALNAEIERWMPSRPFEGTAR